MIDGIREHKGHKYLMQFNEATKFWSCEMLDIDMSVSCLREHSVAIAAMEMAIDEEFGYKAH